MADYEKHVELAGGRSTSSSEASREEDSPPVEQRSADRH